MPSCNHSRISWQSSPYAASTKYKPYSAQQLVTAATGSRKSSLAPELKNAALYPPPLILPNDELALDPSYPPQSFVSWLGDPDRNEACAETRTIYVAYLPDIDKSLLRRSHAQNSHAHTAAPPLNALDDILSYQSAFFHGFEVQQLKPPVMFYWERSESLPKKVRVKSPHTYVLLCSSTLDYGTEVRVRRTPKDDSHPSSSYEYQLNLSDMLDHAIDVLPKDAYALLFLTNHDLYEDDEDDFCCGRAYGGSRVAIVSTAQYQTETDSLHGIEDAVHAGHFWPGSSCQNYLDKLCDVGQARVSKRKRANTQPKQKLKSSSEAQPELQKGNSKDDPITIDASLLGLTTAEPTLTPLEAAFEAHFSHRAFAPAQILAPPDRWSLLLRRICLTVSHELLHCFGLDHCVYYACAMQGTSGMHEDSRCPMYLCPVCENKLAYAVRELGRTRRLEDSRSGNRDVEKQERKRTNERAEPEWWRKDKTLTWKRERYAAILNFCDGLGDHDLGFLGLKGWTSNMLEQSHLESHE